MGTSPRILITAFEPFGNWAENASALCLNRLLPLLPDDLDVTSRIYPVEFDRACPLLESDLRQNFDLALHLGQAQQTSRIRLEAVGLNIGAVPGAPEAHVFPLVPDGPAAYHSPLPLTQWSERLRAEGFPAYVSYHAGTYLCNATLYWGLHLIESLGLRTDICFVHVPLDVSQVAALPNDYLNLSSELAATGVARLIDFWLQGWQQIGIDQ